MTKKKKNNCEKEIEEAKATGFISGIIVFSFIAALISACYGVDNYFERVEEKILDNKVSIESIRSWHSKLENDIIRLKLKEMGLENEKNDL